MSEHFKINQKRANMFSSFPQKVPTHFPHSYKLYLPCPAAGTTTGKYGGASCIRPANHLNTTHWRGGFPGGSLGKKNIAVQETQDMWVRSLSREDHLKEATGGNLLQYSCLENLMDREGWQAMAHRLTKSWTQLKGLSTHACMLGFNFLLKVIQHRHKSV